jgi:NTE family protein
MKIKTEHRKNTVGLALGGGVARGWAHIGAIKALMEANIEIDIISGTSIGALVGGFYVTGKIDTLEKWALTLNKNKVFNYLDIQWGGTSIIKGQRLSRVLKSHFRNVNIEDVPQIFIAVSCDLKTGEEIWLQSGSILKAIEASYALPGIFEPVRINGKYLIDGALANPVPVSACRSLGANIVIGIGLNDYGGNATSSNNEISNPRTLKKSRENFIGKLIQKVYNFRPEKILMDIFFRKNTKNKKPKLGMVMIDALDITMDRLARNCLAKNPADIYITPSISHIGMLEFTKAEELINLGYEAVKKEIPNILKVINN